MTAARTEPQSEPEEHNAAAAPRVICAWCGAVLRPGAEPVSHGICETCEARWGDDLEGAP